MDKLTVIQIMGIVISGMGGLVATFTDTRTKNKKRLTKSGWWAISLIAAGIALGGIGQVIANLESKSDAENVMERLEQQKSNSDAIVSNLRQQYMLATNSLAELERQSILAGKSLDELQRVNTRFEQVTVRHAIYRLPDSAPVVAALSDFLDQCVSQKEINPTNNAYPEIKRCVYTREHNVASPTGDGESNLYVIENLASYQSAFRTNIPELRQINELLKSLLAPNLVLRLSKEPLDRRIAEDRNNDHISQPEDFSAEGSRPKREETSLVYSPLTKKIFVH